MNLAFFIIARRTLISRGVREDRVQDHFDYAGFENLFFHDFEESQMVVGAKD